MPNYVATDYAITGENLEVIAAAFETYLETRDSTNNPIFYIDIIQQGDLMRYTGVILTKGA
jgi:hypothetical protein